MLAADLRIASEGLTTGAAWPTVGVGNAIQEDDAAKAPAKIRRRQQSTPCAFHSIAIFVHDEYAWQFTTFRASTSTGTSVARNIIVLIHTVHTYSVVQ